MFKNNYVINVFNEFKNKNKNKKEYLQAVEEILSSIEILFDNNEEYEKYNILERFLEPERYIEFKVTWLDDLNNIRVNKGYRVQYNSALGPYKGGLRFHKSVNESIIKFLGLEQSLKNSLTSMLIGGGKGGSDFDPKGKSDYEIMRFCQAFMNELYRHIGKEIDVPAGDIGVGQKEISYLFGQYKKITNNYQGVLTGKTLEQGGSLLRKEATGYGLCYFASTALKKLKNMSLKDKRIIISGSGNVAIYALEKASELGAKVVAMSDSNGYIYDESGIDLNVLKRIKEESKARIKEYKKYIPSASYNDDSSLIWNIKCDIALPCATQNEITLEHAKTLVNNGLKAIFEGSNMSSTNDAYRYFINNYVIYGPSKACNAGGVIVSALEMSQNNMRLFYSKEKVDKILREKMNNIFENIYLVNKEYNFDINDLSKGANVYAFKRLAQAMINEGVI